MLSPKALHQLLTDHFSRRYGAPVASSILSILEAADPVKPDSLPETMIPTALEFLLMSGFVTSDKAYLESLFSHIPHSYAPPRMLAGTEGVDASSAGRAFQFRGGGDANAIHGPTSLADTQDTSLLDLSSCKAAAAEPTPLVVPAKVIKCPNIIIPQAILKFHDMVTTDAVLRQGKVGPVSLSHFYDRRLKCDQAAARTEPCFLYPACHEHWKKKPAAEEDTDDWSSPDDAGRVLFPFDYENDNILTACFLDELEMFGQSVHDSAGSDGPVVTIDGKGVASHLKSSAAGFSFQPSVSVNPSGTGESLTDTMDITDEDSPAGSTDADNHGVCEADAQVIIENALKDAPQSQCCGQADPAAIAAATAAGAAAAPGAALTAHDKRLNKKLAKKMGKKGKKGVDDAPVEASSSAGEAVSTPPPKTEKDSEPKAGRTIKIVNSPSVSIPTVPSKPGSTVFTPVVSARVVPVSANATPSTVSCVDSTPAIASLGASVSASASKQDGAPGGASVDLSDPAFHSVVSTVSIAREMSTVPQTTVNPDLPSIIGTALLAHVSPPGSAKTKVGASATPSAAAGASTSATATGLRPPAAEVEAEADTSVKNQSDKERPSRGSETSRDQFDGAKYDAFCEKAQLAVVEQAKSACFEADRPAADGGSDSDSDDSDKSPSLTSNTYSNYDHEADAAPNAYRRVGIADESSSVSPVGPARDAAAPVAAALPGLPGVNFLDNDTRVIHNPDESKTPENSTTERGNANFESKHQDKLEQTERATTPYIVRKQSSCVTSKGVYVVTEDCIRADTLYNIYQRTERNENLLNLIGKINIPVYFGLYSEFKGMNEFRCKAGAILAGRYIITETIFADAAFSITLKATDLRTNRAVCLKVVNNDKDTLDQCINEIRLLDYINRHDAASGFRHFVHMLDFFYVGHRLVIVFELLDRNLYTFYSEIQSRLTASSSGSPLPKAITPAADVLHAYQTRCNPMTAVFTMPVLQHITRQILEAIGFLHRLSILHLDLKHENLVLRNGNLNFDLKLVDIGSSAFLFDEVSTYVQSRSYRSPEVILGLPYDGRADVFSIGPILLELITGKVTFPIPQHASDKYKPYASMLARLVGLMGPIPREMILGGRDSHKYFTKDLFLFEERNCILGNKDPKEGVAYNMVKGEDYVYVLPKRSSIRSILGWDSHTEEADVEFLQFIQDVMAIDPARRPTAEEALKHKWLSKKY